MAAPLLSFAEGRAEIRAPTYTVSWLTGAAGVVKFPYIDVHDAAGALWMRLNVLSSIHRVDCADESTSIAEPRVSTDRDDVVVVVRTQSSAWRARSLTVRCTPETLELTCDATGDGRVGDVTVFGGDAVLPTGAAGTFRSAIEARALFVPTPTEPVAFVRSSATAAALGVVGDAEPGRLNSVFSPPPLMFAFGRSEALDALVPPEGAWLAAWLRAPVAELGVTAVRHEPLDGGFLIRLAYEGHTLVSGEWTSPTVVLRPVASADDALRAYRADLVEHALAADDPPTVARWWLEPLFCGWGAQVEQGGTRAPDMCRQDLYDPWLQTLRAAGIVPGTVVIDDRWQSEYGTAEPDTDAWPDLKGWIAERHADGQRVVLWWKAWDPTGVPATECVTDATGRAIAVDPGSRAYRLRLEQIIDTLVSPDGLDADGLKVDFTQRTPSGATLSSAPDSDGVWGIAAVHRLVGCLYRAAKAAKSDALVITHTVHPSFGDITDMVRTNDVLEDDDRGRPVSVAEQLRTRARIASMTLPHHPIDTDQWPMPSRSQWLEYARIQPELGVPALYFVDSVGDGDVIWPEHLDVIRGTWRQYRERMR